MARQRRPAAAEAIDYGFTLPPPAEATAKVDGAQRVLDGVRELIESRVRVAEAAGEATRDRCRRKLDEAIERRIAGAQQEVYGCQVVIDAHVESHIAQATEYTTNLITGPAEPGGQVQVIIERPPEAPTRPRVSEGGPPPVSRPPPERPPSPRPTPAREATRPTEPAQPAEPPAPIPSEAQPERAPAPGKAEMPLVQPDLGPMANLLFNPDALQEDSALRDVLADLMSDISSEGYAAYIRRRDGPGAPFQFSAEVGEEG